MPVPALRAAMLQDGMLGMLLEDLGDSIREPTERDTAIAAVRLHTAVPPTWLDRHDEPELAALPDRALTCLEHPHAAGRYGGTDDLRDHLAGLAEVAQVRAVGADRPPLGLCHGELHPTALHLGRTGWRLLDFAMALVGPQLLDLAAWSGLRRPPDPPATRALIEQYVRAGGHHEALADRGGLPAEYWALGWHRIQAAHWLLECAISGIDGPDTDARHIHVLRRQLTSARQLLNGQAAPSHHEGHLSSEPTAAWLSGGVMAVSFADRLNTV